MVNLVSIPVKGISYKKSSYPFISYYFEELAGKLEEIEIGKFSGILMGFLTIIFSHLDFD